MVVRVALPAGGLLYSVSSLLRSLGETEELFPDSRRLTAASVIWPDVQYVRCRSVDIPALIEGGLVEIGFAPLDHVENGAFSLESLGDTQSSVRTGEPADWRWIVPKEHGHRSLEDYLSDSAGRGLAVVSQMTRVVTAWLDERHLGFQVMKIHGSSEGLVSAGSAAAAVDVVRTGASLAANGLIAMDSVLKSTVHLWALDGDSNENVEFVRDFKRLLAVT